MIDATNDSTESTESTESTDSTDSTDSKTDVALAAVNTIPRNELGPVFNAPWEAEAFAMTLSLYEKGVFTWPQWANVLAGEISRAQAAGDPDLGDTYYHHWLAALERIVVEQGITDQQRLAGLYDDWNKAALSTPHGQPIVLTDE